MHRFESEAHQGVYNGKGIFCATSRIPPSVFRGIISQSWVEEARALKWTLIERGEDASMGVGWSLVVTELIGGEEE
jgi:hypothetical protein